MNRTSKTYIAIPPGSTIRDQLKDRNMTQKDFAARLDMTEKHVSQLINGEVRLTPDVANRLESVLGIPASFWNNLEAQYQAKLIKVQEENTMDDDCVIVKNFPVHDMIKFRWITVETLRDVPQLVRAVRQFFEVAFLRLLFNPKITRFACRRLSITDKSNLRLLTIAQKAKIESRSISVSSCNLQKLESYLPVFREMTGEDIATFHSRLSSMLAECGIAFVFLPHLSSDHLHGVTFTDGKKIVLCLTNRRKSADIFWFSFFHELAHIINGDIYKEDGSTEDDEKAADVFAADTLINPKMYAAFVHNGQFSDKDIVHFAKNIGVAPHIVLGRLQKDCHVPFSYHKHLKQQYTI